MNRSPLLLGVFLTTTCGIAYGVQASHFETRFVERVGSTDVLLPGNVIDATDGNPRNIRIQMGVFDDAAGAAPVGGFLGWATNGRIGVGGAIDNSDERRNPGRLAPFNWSTRSDANGVPELPGGDPFTDLNSIDATAGIQGIPWFCGPDGQPLPMPTPVIRGINNFVSVFAFSIDPAPFGYSYSITAQGGLFAVTRWDVFQPSTTVPDCSDPDNPVTGFVSYLPIPTPSLLFTSTLRVTVPSPTGGVLACGALLLSIRRRRRQGCDTR